MTSREILNNSTNPYYNLALDHAIFLSYNDSNPWVRYWQNKPSVILGKGQELSKEVNIKYCQREKIVICRRISGGGAVYHDLGNLNVSIFLNTKYLPSNSIKEIHDLILGRMLLAFKNLGSGYSKKENAIFYNGRKISGTAAYRQSNKLLYHFTILFDANLIHLENALLAKDQMPKSKRASRYAPTINIPNFDFHQWRKVFLKQFSITTSKEDFEVDLAKAQWIPHSKYVDFPTISERNLAKDLEKEIYSDKEWINTGRWAKFINKFNQVMQKQVQIPF